MQDMADELLDELHNAVEPLFDQFEQSNNHALFVLAAKDELSDADERDPEIYMKISGAEEVLVDALYLFLHHEISAGRPALFNTFRYIVRAIEEDLEISPDDELFDDDETSYLH